MKKTLDFFNNASVGAFLGALFAFILVIFTDLMRKYRNRTLLKHLVIGNRGLAEKKLEMVELNLSRIREEGKTTNSPFMPFPTKTIKDYQFQVLDILKPNQRQALDVLLYWMESIDGILSQATRNALLLKRITKKIDPNFEISMVIENYRDDLEEARANLNSFIELSECYGREKYKDILSFYH